MYDIPQTAMTNIQHTDTSQNTDI